MNDALKMQISAFVDGELPENEAELLLRRLSQDAELREQVAHYMAIGRLLRREREVSGMYSLRHRILAELGQEVAELASVEEETGSPLVRPAVGFAIAASVALLAIVGLRQTNLPTGAEAVDVPVAGITEPVIDSELLEMHRRHTRSAADLGSRDMLSRFVTFESRQDEWVEVSPESPADDSDDEKKEDEKAQTTLNSAQE
jgi:anti-sigma factor RsiW